MTTTWTSLILCLWLNGQAQHCRAIGYFEDQRLCQAMAEAVAPPPEEQAILRCLPGAEEVR